MKKALFIFLTLATGFIYSPSASGSLFKDEFETTSLDESRWKMTAPEPDSIALAENGSAVFSNGGTLTTVQDLPEKFDLYGSVDFTGSDADAFEIIFRTDGKTSASGELLNGVRLKLFARNVSGSSGFKTVTIDVPSGPTLVVTNSNQSATRFHFRIADDGSTVRFYCASQLQTLSRFRNMLTIPGRGGNKLVLRNTRVINSSSGQPVHTAARLDYIRVEPFPAPLSFSRETGLRFLFHGDPKGSYILETSTNMVSWRTVLSFNPTEDGFLASDFENRMNSPLRFYRVRPSR